VLFLGGAFQMLELSRMLQSSGETPSTDPAIAIIYDSVPGRWSLSSMLAAFLAPFRSTVARMLIAIPLTIIYSFLTAFSFITRERSSVDQMREALNKARVLPWTNKETPRLYIYSDTDELVQQEAVAEHIAKAQELGLNVRSEYFKGSAHVSHVRADADRYWAAVKKVWAEATNSI
jgi:alpha-beta hydrolase superfamily lysophospholipase